MSINSHSILLQTNVDKRGHNKWLHGIYSKTIFPNGHFPKLQFTYNALVRWGVRACLKGVSLACVGFTLGQIKGRLFISQSSPSLLRLCLTMTEMQSTKEMLELDFYFKIWRGKIHQPGVSLIKLFSFVNNCKIS